MRKQRSRRHPSVWNRRCAYWQETRSCRHGASQLMARFLRALILLVATAEQERAEFDKVAPQEGASAPTASRCTDIPSLHHDDPISAETGRIESLQQAHEQCVTLLEAGIAKAKRGGGPWASSTTSLRGGSSASVASSECSDSQVLFSLPPVTQRRTGSSSSWEVQSSSSVSSLGWRS